MPHSRVVLQFLTLAAVELLAGQEPVLVEGIPHVRQKPDFCGEACVEMLLRKAGHQGDQDWVFDQAGVDPTLGRGCRTAELTVAVRKIGYRPGIVWHRLPVARAEAGLRELWEDVSSDLRRGIPSIVCMRFDTTAGAPEHSMRMSTTP